MARVFLLLVLDSVLVVVDLLLVSKVVSNRPTSLLAPFWGITKASFTRASE